MSFIRLPKSNVWYLSNNIIYLIILTSRYSIQWFLHITTSLPSNLKTVNIDATYAYQSTIFMAGLISNIG